MKTSTHIKKTSTFNCYLPVFYGFYGSVWDEPDFEGEAEHYNLPENFPFYDYVNYSDYKQELSKKFVNAVQSELKEYITEATFNNIDSPKYYNFTNDKIDVTVTINKKLIKKFIYNNLEAFEQYLKDHHKSRDGFNSFYSHTFEDWKRYTANFTDYTEEGYVCLTSILRFIAEQEQIDESCLHEASYEVSISEFYNEDFDKLVNLLEGIKENEFVDYKNLTKFTTKKYNDIEDLENINETINSIIEVTREHYRNSEVLAIVTSLFNEDNCNLVSEEIINVEAIVEAEILKIDNQTISLEL